MENKKLVYILIGFFALLLIGGLFFGLGRISGNTIKEETTNNLDLSEYRSEEIPEKCRLPEYEDSIEEWKEHLSHHQNTLYCLDYYNNEGE